MPVWHLPMFSLSFATLQLIFSLRQLIWQESRTGFAWGSLHGILVPPTYPSTILRFRWLSLMPTTFSWQFILVSKPRCFAKRPRVLSNKSGTVIKFCTTFCSLLTLGRIVFYYPTYQFFWFNCLPVIITCRVTLEPLHRVPIPWSTRTQPKLIVASDKHLICSTFRSCQLLSLLPQLLHLSAVVPWTLSHMSSSWFFKRASQFKILIRLTHFTRHYCASSCSVIIHTSSIPASSLYLLNFQNHCFFSFLKPHFIFHRY